MWINPDQDEFAELPLPRPTVLPDEIFLLGETSAKDYVPLQVDDEDRLVVELVNPDYIARLPVNLSAATAVLVEDTPGWVYQIMLFNHSGSAVVVQLWYADAVPGGTARVFWVGSVPANFYVQIDCHLEIGDSLLYAAASTVDVVKILCCMHKGIQYVRGT